MNSYFKIYLEHRVFVRTTQDVALINKELKQKMLKNYPEIVSSEQDRLFLEIPSDKLEAYRAKGYVVGDIDTKPTIILSRTSYELPQKSYNEAEITLKDMKYSKLLNNFAVVEIIDSKFTDILGV